MRRGRIVKRLLTVTTLAGLTALALSGIAVAQTAGPTGLPPAPPEETKTFAKGKGVDFEGGEFNFSARDRDGDPMTDAAKGPFNFESEGFFLKSKVRCLVVIGNGAHFIAEVTKSSEFPPGTLVQVDATDSGEPGGEGDTFLASLAESEMCRPPGVGDPIQEGDITIQGGIVAW